MLLGFKRNFSRLVENGSKTHTIRARRKTTPRPGEICHCYTNMRQKNMRLLGRFLCIRVQDIAIRFTDASDEMAEFWVKTHGQDIGGKRFFSGIHTFVGHVIHWAWRSDSANRLKPNRHTTAQKSANRKPVPNSGLTR